MLEARKLEELRPARTQLGNFKQNNATSDQRLSFFMAQSSTYKQVGNGLVSKKEASSHFGADS